MTDQTNTPSLMGRRHYVIATDGSCNPNPGTGGWGAVIQLREGETVLRQRAVAGQGEMMTSTNNKMEMTAALRGLEVLAEPLPVTIISDSEYVINGMTGGLEKWKAAGWKNSKGPVKNQELWEQLDRLSRVHAVEWVWQRGHVGHDLNEIAHQLASNGAQGMYRSGVKSVRRRHPDWFW